MTQPEVNVQDSDGELSEEEIEEMKVIAQQVMADEDTQTSAAVSQAVLTHLKERVLSTRIQMEMLTRKNADLEQQVANLKNQLAQARRKKAPAKSTPAKKATSTRKKA